MFLSRDFVNIGFDFLFSTGLPLVYSPYSCCLRILPVARYFLHRGHEYRRALLDRQWMPRAAAVGGRSAPQNVDAVILDVRGMHGVRPLSAIETILLERRVVEDLAVATPLCYDRRLSATL